MAIFLIKNADIDIKIADIDVKIGDFDINIAKICIGDMA